MKKVVNLVPSLLVAGFSLAMAQMNPPTPDVTTNPTPIITPVIVAQPAPVVAPVVAPAPIPVVTSVPVITPAVTPAPAPVIVPAFDPANPKKSIKCEAGKDIIFNEVLKFDEPGKGWVKFKASGKEGINVVFSSFPKMQGTVYQVKIGELSNTQSLIQKTMFLDVPTKVTDGFSEFVLDINKGGNPAGTIAGGLPGDGTKLEDYWIKIDNGTITYGKGTVLGNNEFGKVVDAAPLKYVQYVGFGCSGLANMSVEFKDLEFSKIVPVEIPILLPDGFAAEEGKAKRITTGSRNNELEVWAIGPDDQLYRYDAYSMASNPWVKQEFKDAAGKVLSFEDVSCASDGTMVALDGQGKAVRYDWDKKAWSAIDPGKGNETLDFEFISAGNKDNIWAVDTDNKDIYELTSAGMVTSWVVRADGVGVYVASGVDGAVVGLNEKGEAFQWNDKWVDMPGLLLERVAVGNKDTIIGSTKDNALFQWKDGKWEPMKDKDGKPANGFDELSVNAAGTIFALDEDGDVYHKGEAGAVVTMPKLEEVAGTTDQAIKTIDDLMAGKVFIKDVPTTLLPTLKMMAPICGADPITWAPVVEKALVVKPVKPGEKAAVTPAPKKAKKVTKPTKKQVEKVVKAVVTKVEKAAPAKPETRAKAKVEKKVAAKPVKAKTTGTGKAIKKVEKVKKDVKKADTIKAKTTKKAVKKAAAKKVVAKPADKAAAVAKPAATPAKKAVAPKPTTAKKPATKTAVAKKPSAKK